MVLKLVSIQSEDEQQKMMRFRPISCYRHTLLENNGTKAKSRCSLFIIFTFNTSNMAPSIVNVLQFFSLQFFPRISFFYSSYILFLIDHHYWYWEFRMCKIFWMCHISTTGIKNKLYPTMIIESPHNNNSANQWMPKLCFSCWTLRITDPSF